MSICQLNSWAVLCRDSCSADRTRVPCATAFGIQKGSVKSLGVHGILICSSGTAGVQQLVVEAAAVQLL